jgi:hypothetical protein
MEDLARARMHEALGVVQPDPRLRVRVMSSLPVQERRPPTIPGIVWRPAAALVALIVGGSIIVSLILARNNATLTGPANTGVVGQGVIVSQVNFRCNLPVNVGYSPAVFVQVQLPGGMVVNRSDPPSSDLYPVSSYDVQAGRWIPVLPSAISPDGRFWAYGTGVTGGSGGPSGSVHSVDLVTGKDSQVWSGPGGAQVFGIVANTIYFEQLTGDAGPTYLWAVDRSRAGSAHRIAAVPAGWNSSRIAVGPAGAFNVRSAADGSSGSLERMDLNSGTVTTWFATSAGVVSLLGLDAQGRPVIAVSGSPGARVLLLTGQNRSVQIADGSNVSFQPKSAQADSHGIWFGEPGSIWLYQPNVGLREVFAMPQSLFPAPPTKQVPGLTMPTPPVGTPSGAEMEVIGSCT